MPKSKKANAIQKVIIVGCVLIALQIVYIYAFSSDEPLTVREAINKQLESSKGEQIEKERKKILAALYDYRSKNNGKFPASLSELMPTYFDRIPIDTETGKPYQYSLVNNVPMIGERRTVLATKGEIKSAQEALIASITEDSEMASYVYDPTGVKDPFLPFNFAPQVAYDADKTPLERYALGQLRLTAVLDSADEAAAMVQNAAGRGYTVRKGTKIGNNNGEVIDILPDRLLILESTTDFTGETKTRTVEMLLRTKPD